MKKSISIQHQGINGGAISPTKLVGFIAVFFDGMKITINAYDGIGSDAIAREKSLIEIVDEKEVIELTSDQLLEAIRFYSDFCAKKNPIVIFRNKHHYLIPDNYSKD